MALVDDVAIGRGLRALRARKGWSQRELARRAGVHHSVISDVEAGRLEQVRLPTLRRVGRPLGLTMEINARWPIADVARLLDQGHASLVEHVVAMLRTAGWEVLVEYTFNDYGDRGSVDILAWHPAAQALLIVEVKTRIADVQASLASFDGKVRVVPRSVARERGWRAAAIGRLLVVAGTHRNRDVVRRHEATFGVVLPSGSRAARRWIRQPRGPLAALWFLPNSGVSRQTTRSPARSSQP